MQIGIDAMGSDDHPAPDVEGTVWAAREWGGTFVLVGNEEAVSAELSKHDTTGLDIRVQHASQQIRMTDKPAAAARKLRDSSMHVGLKMLKDGEVDAFVSAGNTGGMLAVATLHAPRRIRGIKRPALGVRFPTPGFPLLIDGGANADCKPEFLVQFGLMGSLFMERVVGIERPRVGIIANGEEDGKGNTLVQESAELLAASSLNFVGGIEPKEFMAGKVDVAVTDGFTGNIMLKTAEAIAKTLLTELRDEIMSSTRTKLGGLLARPAFDAVRQKLNPDTVGGAPLLGVDGAVIIGHGRSNATAIKHAIGQARQMVESGVVDAIKAGIQ